MTSNNLFKKHLVYNDRCKTYIKNFKVALKGSGYTLTVRGRNKERQKFATTSYEAGRNGFRQDLPLKYATHVNLYLRIRNVALTESDEGENVLLDRIAYCKY
jgi:hypothetical protein